MTVVKCTRGALAAFACLALLPSAALAQSSITGAVSDNTGGVLPGVTVEASSPALIEGSRLALPCTHIIRSGQLQHAPVVQCGSRWLRWTFVRNRAT